MIGHVVSDDHPSSLCGHPRCRSILVGLALDYDIFLMSRVVEFRRLGWSDRFILKLGAVPCV